MIIRMKRMIGAIILWIHRALGLITGLSMKQLLDMIGMIGTVGVISN